MWEEGSHGQPQDYTSICQSNFAKQVTSVRKSGPRLGLEPETSQISDAFPLCSYFQLAMFKFNFILLCKTIVRYLTEQ
jgi:hypothetical protein